jgi:hypothetical protein
MFNFDKIGQKIAQIQGGKKIRNLFIYLMEKNQLKMVMMR